MAEDYRITVRVSPAVYTQVADRVRHGGKLSDIVRQALEAYLGLRPTDCPTPATETPSDLSDMQAHLEAIEHRLARLETAQSGVRQRPTTRAKTSDALSGLSDTMSDSPALIFDPARHYLGKPCARGHLYQDTGQSVRLKSSGNCPTCKAIDQRARRHGRAAG